MKFARYEDQGAVRDAAVGDGDRLHDLGPGQDIDELIKRGGRAALLDAGAAALGAEPGPAVAGVRPLPPLHPASIRDSASFEAHVEGARKSQKGDTDPVPQRWYEAPCFYFTNPHACVGAFDDVERFPGSELFDLELEVGVVYRARQEPDAAGRGAGHRRLHDLQRLVGTGHPAAGRPAAVRLLQGQGRRPHARSVPGDRR